MLYSHVALLMLRVFSLVQEAGMTMAASMAESAMRTAHIEGDVQLGCLFPIHRKIHGTESCGEIWEQYGIQRTEVALETVRRINDRTDILPGIKLGIDVRDSCWTERIAMQQTIAFIRDAIGQTPASTCCPDNYNCTDKQANLAAVIGPGSSATTLAVQNLLQVFRIPQVGYSATTKDLSDKTEFKYFMRLVPSDSWQAKAMVQIVKEFGWNYVAVVYSDGNYGEKGFEELEHYIQQEDEICIARSEKIKSLAPEQDFDLLLHTIGSLDPRPNVVICFCEGQTITNVFKAVKRHKEKYCVDPINSKCNATQYDFQWIGSESWSDRADVVEGIEDYANGSISLRIFAPNVAWFDTYYFDLTPDKNEINPWFGEFWEQKFRCKLPSDEEEEKDTIGPKIPDCIGNENVSMEYEQDPKVSQVINSVYTVATGLHNMFEAICGKRKGLCPEMQPLNGTLLLEYMMNVTFVDGFGQEIDFDRNGDPPARYDVLNLQVSREKKDTKKEGNEGLNEPKDELKAEYVKVGEYYRGQLNLSAAEMKWSFWSGHKSIMPESVCSRPCPVGEIQITSSVSSEKCCWMCKPCEDHQIRKDILTCEDCDMGSWPNFNKTACYELEVKYLRWSHPAAILGVSVSCLGIVATLFITAVFLRFNSTPVVKATTRELSYIILFGILLCYGITFAIVVQPTNLSCFLVRTVPGLAFAMIYGALLTKTNRIARILAGSKKRILTKKPRFLSTTSQVVITWLLVAVELAIETAAVILEWPEADYDADKKPREMVLICVTSSRAFFAPYGWDLFLIMLCTLYAVKTRNLPENFNEAKFIGFTMYTTCIIWLAFITIYFGSPNKAITMCMSFSLSASVALVLLFFPKIYIILFQPHKNVRSSYATTKVIRCHFGPPSTGGTQQEHKLSKTMTSTSGESMNEIRKRKASGPPVRFDSTHKPPLRANLSTGAATRTLPAELSVIEESQISLEDLTSTAIGKTSRASEMVSLVGSASSNRPIIRQVACQTDEWLLDQFLNAPTSLEDFLRTSGSSPRPSGSSNVKFKVPKRTLSEYPSKSREGVVDNRRAGEGRSHPGLTEKASSDEEILRLLDRPNALPLSDSDEDNENKPLKGYYAFRNMLDDAADGRSELIADRLGHTVETFVSPATTLAQVELKTSPQELVRPPHQDSVLSRLGYSIKRKIRRNSTSNTKPGKPGENGAFEMDPSTPNTPKTSLTQSRSSAVIASNAGTFETKIIPDAVPVHESEADSGVATQQCSMDSSGRSKSSKHSSLSSKQSSAKSKISNEPQADLRIKHNDEAFQDLFQRQGLEATYLSESTLV